MSTGLTGFCLVNSVPRTAARIVARKLSKSKNTNLQTNMNRAAAKGCCGGALISRCRTPTRAFLTSHGSTNVRLQATMTTEANTPKSPPATESTAETPAILSKKQARDLAIRLTPEERDVLISALQESQSQKAKAEYEDGTQMVPICGQGKNSTSYNKGMKLKIIPEGQLAAFRWRSKFGRPSRVPSLGDVDPTGTYCAVPEDWLLRKYVETVPQPTKNDLFRVSLTNAIPFIGFGFLDNFFMIIAGDQIETSLGAVISLSTMAAAAFGNTISDILGIGSAFYVERLVQKIGFKAPKLTPIQMDLPKSRRAANLGRVLGVTIGCLLGMTPLLILHKGGKDKEAKEKVELVKANA